MHLLFLFIFLLSGPVMSQVTSMESAVVKKHIKGAEIKFLLSSKVSQMKNAFVGYLTIPAKGKVPEHRDSTEEYLFVIKGSGQIWIDDKKYLIKEKDLVYMPARAKVKFQNDNSIMEVLQVFAGPGPEKKYESPSWKPVLK